ncbi:hypothetical protein TYRP_011720 [Tyrophagus putrescentiae]|nr:hypothetical protein TYRP_011720 [Tyrophagus putrescentiae]
MRLRSARALLKAVRMPKVLQGLIQARVVAGDAEARQVQADGQLHQVAVVKVGVAKGSPQCHCGDQCLDVGQFIAKGGVHGLAGVEAVLPGALEVEGVEEDEDALRVEVLFKEFFHLVVCLLGDPGVDGGGRLVGVSRKVDGEGRGAEALSNYAFVFGQQAEGVLQGDGVGHLQGNMFVVFSAG